MREIKFRAWTDNLKDGGKMYYQREGEHYNPIFSPAGYGLLNPTLKIMQFTGLLDKNGVGIYEGDILKDDENYYCYVDFCDGEFIKRKMNGGYAFGIGKRYANNSEVIGNIWENSNLISS